MLLMSITETNHNNNQSKVKGNLLSFFFMKVFVITKIVANLVVVKDWFGFNYTDINNAMQIAHIVFNLILKGSVGITLHV